MQCPSQSPSDFRFSTGVLSDISVAATCLSVLFGWVVNLERLERAQGCQREIRRVKIPAQNPIFFLSKSNCVKQFCNMYADPDIERHVMSCSGSYTQANHLRSLVSPDAYQATGAREYASKILLCKTTYSLSREVKTFFLLLAMHLSRSTL